MKYFWTCWLVLLAACARPPRPAIEDLSGRENLSAYTLQQVRGTRDGGRLDAEARFWDRASVLTVALRFDIGAPTRLRSGVWQWNREGVPAKGSVQERSVMFLGGQDGPPSVGGRFDLLDAAGAAKYRITIPTTELKVRL